MFAIFNRMMYISQNNVGAIAREFEPRMLKAAAAALPFYRSSALRPLRSADGSRSS